MEAADEAHYNEPKPRTAEEGRPALQRGQSRISFAEGLDDRTQREDAALQPQSNPGKPTLQRGASLLSVGFRSDNSSKRGPSMESETTSTSAGNSPPTSPVTSTEMELPYQPKSGIAGLFGTFTRSSAAPASRKFDAPENAVIIFDWDDTLCPTYWACDKVEKNHTSSNLGREQQEMLRQNVAACEKLLRESRKLARVAIVTLAAPDWFEESQNKLFPGLDIEALFRELGIKVYFASKTLESSERMRTVAKKKAMKKCLQTLYPMMTSKAERWNVLSVGDSVTEQEALKELLAEYSSAPLCKTLKFATEPSIEVLTDQMLSLVPHLQSMVSHSKDFDRSSNMMWL